jgi:hypothetical protein
MGGKKVCPFGTCAQPHLGRLPLAAHITDVAADPRCALRDERTKPASVDNAGLPFQAEVDAGAECVSRCAQRSAGEVRRRPKPAGRAE